MASIDYIPDNWQEECKHLMLDGASSKIIEQIRQPDKEHLLYYVPDFYEQALDIHILLYGPIPPPLKRIWDAQHRLELHLKELIEAEKKLRKERNIRLLFWAIILNIRKKQFLYRFWAPGGKKETEIASKWKRQFLSA